MWKKKHKSWNAASRGVSRVFNVFSCVEEEKVESRLRGIRFSASLERGTGERNGFLFLSPSREICARVCERVYEPVVWTSDVQRTSVTREKAVLHLPAESFRRRAHHEGMSAVIPKRGMLLNQLDKRYDTRGATIIAIEWLFVLLKGPFS